MITSNIKHDFTIDEVQKILMALGSDPAIVSGDNLVFQTICHNPAHQGSYKLYYYEDTGLFHCYTSCGDSFDIYELVKRSLKSSFREALYFIQRVLGTRFDHQMGFTPPTKLTDDWDILQRYSDHSLRRKERLTTVPTYSPISTNILDYYLNTCPVEWQREGISCRSMQRFGIRFDAIKNEVIIPHYSVEGQLIGIRSRSFDQAVVENGNKYMPTRLEGDEFNHALRFNLYGLNWSKQAVQRSKKIMLFESEKSCLMCDSFYGDDNFSAAVCGSNISLPQRDLILAQGVREVFIGFDKEFEEAYTPQSDRYAEKILRLAHLFTSYCTTYILYDTEQLLQYKDSPVDQGKAAFEQLMKNKFEIKTGE